MKVVQTITPETVTVDFDMIPSHESNAMFRTLTNCVSRLFKNPDIRADYECWKKEKENIK